MTIICSCEQSSKYIFLTKYSVSGLKNVCSDYCAQCLKQHVQLMVDTFISFLKVKYVSILLFPCYWLLYCQQ